MNRLPMSVQASYYLATDLVFLTLTEFQNYHQKMHYIRASTEEANNARRQPNKAAKSVSVLLNIYNSELKHKYVEIY